MLLIAPSLRLVWVVRPLVALVCSLLLVLLFPCFIDMSAYPLGSVRRLCSFLSRRYPSCVCSFEVRSSVVCVSCVCAPAPSSIPADGLPF